MSGGALPLVDRLALLLQLRDVRVSALLLVQDVAALHVPDLALAFGRRCANLVEDFGVRFMSSTSQHAINLNKVFKVTSGKSRKSLKS